MKYNRLILSPKILGLMILITGTILYSCKKQKIDDLGALPKADFTINPGANGNSVVLINTTATPAIAYWAVPGLNLTTKDLKGDTARLHFIFMGTYPVTLYVAGHGGLDSITKTVTIAQNDPSACNGTAIGFLTNCGTKKWKLDPAPAAYKVGPGADDGSWWSNNAGDVGARYCEFNDEYNFTFNASGDFVYDNKGDYYSDGYIGTSPTNSCQVNSQLPASQAAWASGNFHYTLLNGGSAGLGQLKVIGFGAHIGLQKVTNGGEVTVPTGTSVTYDILSMTHNAGGYDLIKLGANLGWGWWTFRLRSY